MTFSPLQSAFWTPKFMSVPCAKYIHPTLIFPKVSNLKLTWDVRKCKAELFRALCLQTGMHKNPAMELPHLWGPRPDPPKHTTP